MMISKVRPRIGRTVFFAVLVSASHAQAQDQITANEQGSISDLQEMSIISVPKNRPIKLGLGSVIARSQLTDEAASDIHQVITSVPGVYMRESDGLDLRPNIGIRGGALSRSQNITLLEDGLLIAPAPYANPMVDYFPTLLRIHHIEILKGATSLRYGPQTSGVLNLLSTPIPRADSGTLFFTVNDRGSYDVLANYGGTDGNWSAVFETVQRQAVDFHDVDRSLGDSGFELEDYLFKMKWQKDKSSLFFKVQYFDENADKSALGLTDADFNRDNNRRYGLSGIDKVETENLIMSFSHEYQWTDEVTATFTFYRNEFNRDGLQFSDRHDLIGAANGQENSVFTAGQAQNILSGVNEAALAQVSLEYMDNNRDAVSQGQELNIHFQTDVHNLDFGFRNHRDREDRRQGIKQYSQTGGNLQLQSRLAATGNNNSIARARVLSAWLRESYQYSNKLEVNFSLRYENIDTQRTLYSTESRSSVADKRSNDEAQWLSGLSLNYQLDEQWQTLLGYYQGFSSIGTRGASNRQKAETSDNYELGLRYQLQGVLFEAVAFYNVFDNKVENCSIEAPCSNGASDNSFFVGEAEVSGIEVKINNVFNLYGFSLPVFVSYTYTQSENQRS